MIPMQTEYEKTEDVKSRIDQVIDASIDPNPDESVNSAKSPDDVPGVHADEKNDDTSTRPDNQVSDAPDDNPTVAPEKPEHESSISDEAVERAIRAGMSISNARKYADDSALLEAVGILVNMQHSAAESKGSDGDDSSSNKPSDDPVPIDLPDDDDISPSVRSYISRLEQSVRRHEATIKAMTTRAAAQESDWISAQIDSLSAAYSKELGSGTTVTPAQLANRDKIRSTYEILSEGYKARGIQWSKEELFKSAVRLVAGDGAPVKDRRQTLSDRRSLETFRPSRAGSRNRDPADTDSIVAQVASELRERIAKSTI